MQAILTRTPPADPPAAPTIASVVMQPTACSVGNHPSDAGADGGVVAEILAAEPELPTMEILHRARQRGYAGGKSALYDLVASMRAP